MSAGRLLVNALKSCVVWPGSIVPCDSDAATAPGGISSAATLYTVQGAAAAWLTVAPTTVTSPFNVSIRASALPDEMSTLNENSAGPAVDAWARPGPRRV